MKAKYLVTALVILVGLTNMVSCQSTKPTSNATTTTVAATLNFEEIKTYLEKTRGGMFITESKISGNNELSFIIGPYSSYINNNKESKIKEADYNSYFQTGDGVIKVLFDDSIRLYKQYPDLTNISIKINYQNKIYESTVSKQDLEKFLSTKINDIQNVSDKVNNKDLRADFETKFVKQS